MKADLYSADGKKKSQLELPKLFDMTPRADLVQKYVNANIFSKMQPYSHAEEAGKRHSASGIISHKRHDWKGHYGKGISRVPRKIMWRRGTQFFWIGAEISSTRGGRRAHGPGLVKRLRKINKKEIKLTFNSVLASTVSKDLITKRYATLEKSPEAPAVIESLPEKSKALISAINSIFSDFSQIISRKKSSRAGKGKMRGRKYKTSAGLLIITADDEKAKSSVFEIRPISELTISDLYPLGRLTLYTKKAIEQLASAESADKPKKEEKSKTLSENKKAKKKAKKKSKESKK